MDPTQTTDHPASQDTVIIERTAHPRAFKFIFSFDIKRTGSVSFTSANQCRHIPLAAGLLEIEGISEVYFSGNVIVVTRDREADWDALEPAVKEVIQNCISTHDPEMRYMPPGTTAADGESGGMDTEGVLSVINNILDQTVRPYIHSHGGELELLAFDPEKNELLVAYQGTCGHCAFSTEGTLYLIRDILREEYDPRITVKVA